MMKRHTRPEVEAMSLSERVRKGSELWQDGHPLPFAPETTEIETPQRFEEKVGEQMLYLIEQLDKLSVAEREKYLEEQRQVAEERVKMALASVKQGSENGYAE